MADGGRFTHSYRDLGEAEWRTLKAEALMPSLLILTS